MTNPSITYGHGFLSDCDDDTDWTEFDAPTLTDTSLTVEIEDIFKLTGTASEAGEYTYWEYELSNVSPAIYPYWIVRFRTSETSVGLGAKVEAVYNSGTEVLFGPSFSTALQPWKVQSGILKNPDEATSIDKIRLYAASDAACTAKSVYYDFALLHKGIFNIPWVNNVSLDLEDVFADLHPPGRVGDISQYLGMNSPDIRLDGKIDVDSTSWGTPYGEYLYYIFREAHKDPWQWFTSDMINCKATPRKLHLEQSYGSDASLRTWWATLKKYDRSNGAETTWNNKNWYGL
jgi:hypothetical protein